VLSPFPVVAGMEVLSDSETVSDHPLVGESRLKEKGNGEADAVSSGLDEPDGLGHSNGRGVSCER